jgi:hypothetical protein
MLKLFILFIISFYMVSHLWLIAVRKTVTFKTIMAFFIVGLSSTTLMTILLQLITVKIIDPKIVFFTVNPFIEEVVKILPIILFLSFSRQNIKSLGILDLALLALAIGVGFEFGESLFYLLGGSKLYERLHFSFWLPQIHQLATYHFSLFKKTLVISFAGHGVVTAAVGMALGYSLVFLRKPAWQKMSLIIPGVVFLWIVYEHAVINYFLSDTFRGEAPPLLEVIHFLDRGGKLIVTAFTLGFLAALIVEEILLSKQCEELPWAPDAKKERSLLRREIHEIFHNAPAGWRCLAKLFAMQGIRRQWAYKRHYFLAQAAGLDKEAAGNDLRLLERRIVENSSEVSKLKDNALQNPWNPRVLWGEVRSAVAKRIGGMRWKTILALLPLVVWVCVFIIIPKLPWSLEKPIMKSLVPLLGWLGIAGAIWTYCLYCKYRGKASNTAEVNEAAQNYALAWIVYSGLGLAIISIFSHILPMGIVLFSKPFYKYFLWYALEDFCSDFGWIFPGALGIKAGVISFWGHMFFPERGPWQAVPDPATHPPLMPGPEPTPIADPQFPKGIFRSDAQQRAMELITKDRLGYLAGFHFWETNKMPDGRFANNVQLVKDGGKFYKVYRNFQGGLMDVVGSEEISEDLFQQMIADKNLIEQTWCNFAVRKFAEQYSLGPLFTGPEDQANIMADKIAKGYDTHVGTFRNVNWQEAEQYAAKGGFAIGILKNPGGNGHAVNVIGGFNGEPVHENMRIFQAGESFGTKDISKGFSKDDKSLIQYYIWEHK